MFCKILCKRNVLPVQIVRIQHRAVFVIHSSRTADTDSLYPVNILARKLYSLFDSVNDYRKDAFVTVCRICLERYFRNELCVLVNHSCLDICTAYVNADIILHISPLTFQNTSLKLYQKELPQDYP